MKHILDHWALILLTALMILLVTLLLDISWPVAFVHLLSTPSGAEVSDGEGFIWISPAVIPVQYGGLNVTLTHPGRVPVDTLLLPEMSEEPVLISLPYRFPVDISSEPSGASVHLDGTFLGCTPLHVNIDEPGTHYLSFTVDNLIIFKDSFSLIADKPYAFHYSLPRLYSSEMIYIPAEACDCPEIQQPYLISRYEVTNDEFCRYLEVIDSVPMRDTTNRWGRTTIVEELFPGDYPLPFYIDSLGKWAIQDGLENNPVAGLTCNAAGKYCEWLTATDTSGISFRLPAESEWYTAAVAGSGGPWPWGSRRPDGDLLNLSDCSEGMLHRHPSIDDGFSFSAPVGSFPCNNWGLFDMAGNVWEFCRPLSPESSFVARGGSWLSSMDDCKCDARIYPDSGMGYPYMGFRIAASVTE